MDKEIRKIEKKVKGTERSLKSLEKADKKRDKYVMAGKKKMMGKSCAPRKMMAKKWIQGAIKHPGALHKQLGVPAGKKIPASKLKKAEHSKSPTLPKRAVLAETLKGFKKK